VKKEELEYNESKTVKVMTGCGHAYITFDFNEKGNIDRISFQRNSKMLCDPELIEGLSRTVTFQSKREIQQMLIDLNRGENSKCRGYNAVVKGAEKRGKMFAYSCSDALAKALLKVQGKI
jgi:hypothetical protein